MSGNTRPSTAPLGGHKRNLCQVKDKKIRLSIFDIMNGGGDEGGSAGAMSMGMVERKLKNKTYRLLQEKKHAYDKITFQLQRKQKELEKVDVEYEELVKEGTALGLHQYEDNARMKPIKTVSTRPVFSRHTSIEGKEKELEKRLQRWRYEMGQEKVYEYMLQRYRQQKYDSDKEKNELKRHINEVNAQFEELEKRKLRVAQSCGEAQSKVDLTRENIRHELELWEKEIAKWTELIAKKRKTAAMYEKALEGQRKLEKKEAGFLTEEESESVKKVELYARIGKTLSRSATSKAVFSKKQEEQRYVEAFVKIGLKLQELSPSLVLKTCLAQSDMRKDLTERAKEAEEKHEKLKKSLQEAQDQLKNVLFAPTTEERTTNRVVFEHEKTLRNMEKKLMHIKEQYSYLENTIQPVKIGLQHLETKLLQKPGVNSTNSTSSSSTKLLLEEPSQRQLQEKSYYSDHETVKFAEMIEQIKFLMKPEYPGIIDTKISRQNRSVGSSLLSLSSFNVRVKSNPKTSFQMVSTAEDMLLMDDFATGSLNDEGSMSSSSASGTTGAASSLYSNASKSTEEVLFGSTNSETKLDDTTATEDAHDHTWIEEQRNEMKKESKTLVMKHKAKRTSISSGGSSSRGNRRRKNSTHKN